MQNLFWPCMIAPRLKMNFSNAKEKMRRRQAKTRRHTKRTTRTKRTRRNRRNNYMNNGVGVGI
jgi:hypothetical protein